MPEEKSDRPAPLDYSSVRSKPPRRFLLILTIACVATALVISLMPVSFNKDPGAYARAKCASNLLQIGLGIILYANENGGVFPESLQTLAAAEYLPAGVFVCPSSNDDPSTAPTTQGQLDDMAGPGHVSYLYIGKGLTDKTVLPNQVIVYEPLADHAGDGMNVLCGDGHVEWVDKTRAMKILAAIKATTQPVILPP